MTPRPSRSAPASTTDGARRRRSITIGATVAFLLATVGTVTLGSRADAYPSGLTPSAGAYFGAFVEPRSGESAREAIRRVEGQIGRPFAIDHQYYRFWAKIPTAHEEWDVEHGRIPFINWKSGDTWAAIANGERDEWLRRRAQAFRSFGAPVYLAFHHEPENDLSHFGSPSDYAAAFRHVVTVFRNEGVTNVAFVWTMMSWTFDPASGRDINQFYPGDDYVDFVGSDGYNWYPGRSGSVWTSFADIFQRTNDFAIAHGKPWIAVEVGCQEDPATPGRKAQWFLDALATAQSWPSLDAFIYYDVDKLYTWYTDTSGSSLQAYGQIANSSWFRAQGPGPVPSPNPPPPPGGSATVVRSGLNGGPQGAPISGPFDDVSTTQSATLTYDDTHARGAFAAKHVLNAGSDAYYAWEGSRPIWFGRLYVWLTADPPGDLRLVRAQSGGELRVSINIRSSGKIGLQDQVNAWVGSSRRSIPTGHWVRLEWRINHRTGGAKIKVFGRPNASRPTEIVNAGPGLNIGSAPDEFQFGRSGSNQFAITFWTDSPGLSAVGFLGPDRAH